MIFYLQKEGPTLLYRLVTHVAFLLSHTYNCALVLRITHDCVEHHLGRVRASGLSLFAAEA